jgi:hypothetical protein
MSKLSLTFTAFDSDLQAANRENEVVPSSAHRLRRVDVAAFMLDNFSFPFPLFFFPHLE